MVGPVPSAGGPLVALRLEHTPQPHPKKPKFCQRCGFPVEMHREGRPSRAAYFRAYDQTPRRVAQNRTKWRERTEPRVVDRIIGVDGEGQGRVETGGHKYHYLAGADEHGEAWYVAADPVHGRGLSTEACLDFFLDLPKRALVVGFAFLYDLTKILADLPDLTLYNLFHEDGREKVENGRIILTPVIWYPRELVPGPCRRHMNGTGDYRLRGLCDCRAFYPVDPGAFRCACGHLKDGHYAEDPYVLNFLNRRLSVRRGTRKCTVWDVFRFFQCKFTAAVKDWKVGDARTVKWLEHMKEERGAFDKLDWEEVKRYCNLECEYLAQTMRMVVKAHEDAGLELKSYYGVGSTAAALLNKMGVPSFKADPPPEMKEAVACAFFGGWFEHDCIGFIPGPVYADDIASAYPYQLAGLPCLTHGKWSRVPQGRELEGRITRSRLACIRWTIAPAEQYTEEQRAWGVLPVRASDGTIVFPLAAAGGWTWKDEFLAARALNEDVQAVEAWVYDTDCDCKPFGQLPWYYRERCRIGKDGAGKVFKFGPNACYGRVAQSKGHRPPFQSWVWAGNCTSGVRAQLNQKQAHAKDPWDVLAKATDSVFSRVPLADPVHVDTGTNDVVGPDGAPKPPLGSWERKVYKGGVFFVRPGVYFPIPASADKLTVEAAQEELEKVRARGLGRKVLYENMLGVCVAYQQGLEQFTVTGIQRFVGVKTGMSHGKLTGVKRSERYGEWVDWPITISFHPMPKREAVLDEVPGTRGWARRLKTWDHNDLFSVPYEPATRSEEAKLIQAADRIAEEQPDTEFIN